jgi:ribosomal-protein-alanine N-acetyltransferase
VSLDLERIETDRLILRPPRPSDAEAVFGEYAQDLDVARYTVWTPHRSVDDSRAFLASLDGTWPGGRRYAWAITLKAGGRLIGMMELRVSGHLGETGYTLGRAHWGKGYATEALRAVIDRALEQPAVYRVWATCDVENRASARVMEKAGMSLEGTLRRWAVLPNISDEPRDMLCFAKTR